MTSGKRSGNDSIGVAPSARRAPDELLRATDRIFASQAQDRYYVSHLQQAIPFVQRSRRSRARRELATAFHQREDLSMPWQK
jgi:hypothetical protein